MARYSVAEAKNSLPSLIDKATAGEEVVITRHGKPVAELRAKSDIPRGDPHAMDAWLRAQRDARPAIAITSVQLLNEMYENDD